MQAQRHGLRWLGQSASQLARWGWRTPWPLSIKILIGVGVLFALQAFPFIGIFLMFVAAPFWSVPLINLAVVVAGVEGLTGRAPRWFVLIPVCWFGFYALAVVREDAALEQVQAEVAEANAAAAPVRYDPAHHDVIAGDFVNELLLRHQIPVVYIEPRRGRDRAVKAARVATGALCETLAARKANVKVMVRKIHRITARRYGLAPDKPVCIVSFDEVPDDEKAGRQIIRIARQRSTELMSGLPVKMTVVSAESGGRRTEIRDAWTARLQPFPMPAVGCFLNSGAPSWDCFARFLRRSRVRVGVKLEEADMLASVMAFPDTAAQQSDAVRNATLLARLEEADKRMDRHREDQLQAFLKDPSAYRYNRELFSQFKNVPEKLAPFADQLITALEAADAHERRTGENGIKVAGAIARLVAQLPDAEIRKHADRILDLLDGSVRGWRMSARPLMQRAALLGEAALPMLTGRLHKPRGNRNIPRPTADAIIALCRMGRPAAAAAGAKLVELWRWRTRERRKVIRDETGKRREVAAELRLSREDRFLYLALLRLGLRDEAGRPEPKGNAKWWAAAWQTVTPQSLPDVCEQVRRLPR